MRKVKESFLFFICLLLSFQSISQSKTDSLSYYSNLTKYPRQDSDLIKAYTYFDRVLKEAKRTNNKNNIGYCLLYKASIEYKGGFYNESEQSAITALELIDKEKNSEYLKSLRPGLYNHLGILYRAQKNFSQAHSLYHQALKFSDSLKDSLTIYNNIANVFKEERKFESAKRTLIKAYEKVQDSNETIIKARVLDNLGVVKSKTDSTKGLEEMLGALKIREAKYNTIGIYSSYNHLAEYYKSISNLSKAKKYARKSLSIAQKLNSATYIQNSLGLIIELKEDIDIKRYKKLNDSIIQAKQRSANRFALLKYDTSKQKRIAKENELKTERQKKLTLFYQFLGAVIFLLLIGSYFFYKEKHKKKIVERVIQTEGRISKKVHDVIANDVYHVIAKIQTKSSSQKEILDDLEKVYGKARNISRDNNTIEEDMDFHELLNDLFNSYQSEIISIITKGLKNIDWRKVTIHKKNMLYRVVKELMTNMSKYSKANLVTLAFEQNNRHTIITYKDNGIGCSLSKKNGLLNAENRIKSVNGQIIFESELGNGFKAKITI